MADMPIPVPKEAMVVSSVHVIADSKFGDAGGVILVPVTDFPTPMPWVLDAGSIEGLLPILLDALNVLEKGKRGRLN